MAVEPPENPFQLKKKRSVGEISKKAKGFSGGVRAGLPAQAARLTHSSAGTGFARKCKIAPTKQSGYTRVFLWGGSIMTIGYISQ